jgi:D-serine deaminase-like pyridoxal phosphate-dependent protein
VRIEDLPTPALLLDLDRLESNLRRMAERARSLGVALRPHIKTHKCVEIAERQQALGASGITVSTLYEAAVFASHGFSDQTWAFPLNPSRMGELAELCDTIRLGVLVDSPEAAGWLVNEGIGAPVWIKVDCGYHRAGVDPEGPLAEEIALALQAATALEFAGLLSHSGQAYDAGSPAEIGVIAEHERTVICTLAGRLRDAGIEVSGVSVGSTPAMSQVSDLKGVTEVRPGNYAFYDRDQGWLGSCSYRDPALTVLTSVVSSQPGATHSVVDAGALALSKDPGPEAAPPSMGEIYEDYAQGRLATGSRVVSLSQEHGIVNARYPLGTRLRLLPNHSCLTAYNFDSYWVTSGDEIVHKWKIWSGREPPSERPAIRPNTAPRRRLPGSL